MLGSNCLTLGIGAAERKAGRTGQEFRLTQTALVVGGGCIGAFLFVSFGGAPTRDEELMKNDYRAALIRREWVHVAGPALRAVFCVSAGLMLFASTSVFGQTAYAMQFNQANNNFGLINLLTGNFTLLGTEGSTLFNDVAGSPNGNLYGIINSASLVTLNTNNGAVLTSVSFSVGGIESLAIASNGTLYGATQGALYTINPLTGAASLVGNFNNSAIGNSGQNIRFGSDGNLYDTDGGVSANNTDLFQISTVNGQATLMGVVTNFPGLCLENAGSQMYGVGIQLGSASSLFQDLVGIDLSSLKPGGTNLDGSAWDISYNLLTANFPNNYNFSSADLFIVPAPEPSTVSLSILGGMLFLMISHKRIRC